MNRIVSFDYIRSIAVIGIVICHFLFNFENFNWLGKWFGDTFNVLFLMMSGVLLGMSWNSKDRPAYGMDFLKHRFRRLSKVYYPFLVVMFMFCIFIEEAHIGLKDVVMHLLYLPWFDKIEGFGHLWFMTMIALCYIGAVLISRIRIVWGGNFLLVLIILIGVSLHTLFSVVHLPGYMFLYLMFFLLAFLKAPKLVSYTDTCKGGHLVVSCFVLVLTIFLYHGSYLNNTILWSKVLGIISAITCLFALMLVFRRVKPNKMVSFVAKIGFEIYLVHHVFAFGRFSIMNVTPHWTIGFMSLMAFSVVAGWGLNRICQIKIRKNDL